MAFGKDHFFARIAVASGLMASGLVLPVAVQASDIFAPSVSADYDRAIICLSQAISYEAGNEPESGQEAVAQVILNRVRHPAYPATVCGVVYQGSQRKTGCQFTFTCDGSLQRGRSAESMARARIVAGRVLAGHASALVGGATHYHANYVSPYWAPSLIKVATIGAHIFYRMPGAPDSPAIVTAGALQGEPLVEKAAVAASLAPPARSNATSRTFSPWGLPALVIDRNGDIRAVGN
jgi:Cell Wall Hydrolase